MITDVKNLVMINVYLVLMTVAFRIVMVRVLTRAGLLDVQIALVKELILKEDAQIVVKVGV